MRVLIISHHVHEWHNHLVVDPDRITLVHRRTGVRKTFDRAVWEAPPPSVIDELVADGWLVERIADAALAVATDRDPLYLRATRDALAVDETWLYPKWLGFPILQLPEDLAWLQMLLCELRPDTVIETGVFRGGSAMFYASILELLGHGQVIAVDVRIDTSVRDAIAAHPLGKRITLLEGDSKDPAIVAQITGLAGRRNLVALDADHSAAHVRAELEAYAPLAEKVVVFDTSMQLAPRWADDNPHHAVIDFLSAHEEWRVAPSFLGAAECGVLERYSTMPTSLGSGSPPPPSMPIAAR